MFIQILFNIAVLIALYVAFVRLNRPAKDDPRLSKGLQLLTSKIAILEDVNDRTELQIQQMMTLVDAKAKELQQKIHDADQKMQSIGVAMNRSLEVAEIFQDKIPHHEIIERENSRKYIHAARLAHRGAAAEEIHRETQLPMNEIEFIMKVNRDQLSFREEDLPEWAREPKAEIAAAPKDSSQSLDPQAAEKLRLERLQAEQKALVDRLQSLQFGMQNLDMELTTRHPNSSPTLHDRQSAPTAAHPAPTSERRLEEVGDEFRRAFEAQSEALQEARAEAERLKKSVAASAPGPSSASGIGSGSGSGPAADPIRKVVFPRIENPRV
ncbi:MAG TPA: DUF2802 domain-containing protein [Pseudobdellovibrionaceae bacterium]|nr:DUF2802 domain-containing protein [Pseudobdellovibrionaceae bacterium]